MRMLGFWISLITGKAEKFSHVLYKMLLADDIVGLKQYKWLSCIRNILQSTGKNNIWLSQTVGPRQAYRLCEHGRFRRACASSQSRQNLRCSHIQAVSQEEPSDRKPDPCPLRMAGHAQLKFVMTQCSKTQIRLTGLS